MKAISCILLALVILLAACGQTELPPEADLLETEVAAEYPPELEEESKPDALRQPSGAVAISAACEHTLALMEDGSLWGWGIGPIGDGTTESRSLPVMIMEDVAFAVAGHYHSFAITTDGALWAWGGNGFGQLGDGTTETRLSPVRIMDDVVYVAMPTDVPNSHASNGGYRSYAIRSDGTLWAWGLSGRFDAADVALGDGATEPRYSPVQILENVVDVVPTNSGGLALTGDGVVYRWNGPWWHADNTQLYPAPILENVASISHCAWFAITTGGELWTLGLEPTWTAFVNTVAMPEPAWVMDDVVYAAAARGVGFAITTDNVLWAWGRNRIPSQWWPAPNLGDGTGVDRDEPVAILEDVVSITVMGNTAYVITNDGTLWGWGNAGGALIGDGSTFSLGDAKRHMWEQVFDEERMEEVVRWLLDDDGGTEIALSPVKILENVVAVAPAYFVLDHGWINGFRTFALTESGAVYAWGVNSVWLGLEDYAVLGDGTTEPRPYPVRIIEAS